MDRASLTHIPHPDSALLGIIDITGNSGQHHGLQQPQAYIPCSPSPWYLGNECGDSRRSSGKSILRVAVSRSPKPTDWNGLRGRNGLGLSGSEKFQKVCTGRCGMWAADAPFELSEQDRRDLADPVSRRGVDAARYEQPQWEAN